MWYLSIFSILLAVYFVRIFKISGSIKEITLNLKIATEINFKKDRKGVPNVSR